MSSPISLLMDDFTNNTQDPVWSASGVAGSGTKAETGGQAVLTLPSSTAGAHAAYYQSSGTYDLTSSSFYWNIATMVSTGVAATALFQLFGDANNQIYWRQLSNAITARYMVAGVDTQLYTATWSASTYKYLRIRETGGTIFWDSSTNGTSWTNRASVAAPWAVTNLTVQFYVSCGNVASPGQLKLDDVNLILPAPSATWRDDTADWSITNRFLPVTLASDGGMQGVIVTADTMDASRVLGGTVRYFAGPLGSSSGGFLQLTEYASLALAQASPFFIPVNGRVDLPAFVDARFMRLYHRSIDASAHLLYEFVPRRVVQAEDIQAESIQAINIAAGAITADKITVFSLSAITASMGSLTMDGPIDITTGSIIGGGGVVTLDATGLTIAGLSSPGYVRSGAVTFTNVSDVPIAGLYGYSDTTHAQVFLESFSLASGSLAASALIATPMTGFGYVQSLFSVQAGWSGGQSQIVGSSENFIFSNGIGAANNIQFTGAVKITLGGLNIGNVAGTGELATSGNVAIGQTINSVVRTAIKGVNNLNTHYQIYSTNNAATAQFYVRNDNRLLLGASGATLEFFGGGGGTRPTVTGSRNANAALASLLTGLATLGLVTDSSTV